MDSFIAIIGVMALVGIFFGLVLAYANKKLSVEMNPLIHVVEDILPKGQCGACGFAGCQAYAEAVVLEKDVAPNLCIPGKKAVAQKVAQLTGKVAEEIEPRVALVKCADPICSANKKYVYSGIDDCLAATLLHSGAKECEYGCIGLGTCVKQCVFGAIELNAQGMPVVNKEKCTGCGKCAEACPKKVIEMIPINAHVAIICNSLDKGAVARKICKVACIGCNQCGKLCPHGAIKMQNNLAVVDSSVCIEKCEESLCLGKCATNAIQPYPVPELKIEKAV
jgi:Na+-translocating ferredoxin:NAD+ oxidoreductase RNF subunit RnfB